MITQFNRKEKLHIVLENADGGNLYKYLTNNFPLDLSRIRKIWSQIVDGIAHLHKKNILMRDLKPENVILDSKGDVKLCDFGWAARMTDESYRRVQGGTYIYMSPEALRGELQGLKSDVWSLGVLLFELHHAMEPYRIGVSCDEQLEFVMGGRIRFKETVDPVVKKVVEACLVKDVEKRPSVEELLKMEYLVVGDNEGKGLLYFY